MKNITISEGQRGRNFGPVSKLDIPLSGGGSSLWIPEDEANDYASKEDIRIDENGEYTPTVKAFRNVDVQVVPAIEPVTFTENGTFKAADAGLEGWNPVTVAIANPSGKVIPKPAPITANGTYLPSADGADGYSSVTVNVGEINTTDDLGNEWEFTLVDGLANGHIAGEDAEYDVSKDCTDGTSISDGTTSVTYNTDGSMSVTVVDGGTTYLVTVQPDGSYTKTPAT